MTNGAEQLARARTCHQAGQLLEAERLYGQIVAADPTNAQAWYLLGAVCQALGRLAEAAASLRQSLHLRPGFAAAHNHLGVVLAQQWQLEEAVASFRQAVRLEPDLAEAHKNLGQALLSQGKPAEAAASLQQLVRLQPDLAEVHNFLGRALTAQWHLDEAAACYRQAVRLEPDFAEAHYNLGLALLRQGDAAEAAASFRLAVRLRPTYATAHSALLLSLHYGLQADPAALYDEHRRWAGRHAGPLAPAETPRSENADPQRCLRVGYVSPDFREHPVALFIEPVLAVHDRRRLHITCYADVARPDEVTRRLQAQTDGWRSIVGVSDEEAAQLIRGDQIDILVDLAGHTGANRLLAFARKPAPIQVAHFGYPDTTGLPTMDYRITDAYADPPGTTERYYTEKLIRLPDVAWCYGPAPGPDVNPPPALDAGHITFGSFNNIPKITGEVIALWARILAAVPDSRLLLLSNGSAWGERRICDAFARCGVDRQRIKIVGRLPRQRYLELYRTVDICLDPFPYNGGVTTCDALWMGVPVISLAGNAYVSRQGVSMLSNLGLPELIAATPDAYVEIAVGLASDLARLRELRATLRERMSRSPLTDAQRFTRGLEEAYRRMWEELLARQPRSG
jgi:predicted O-linked N-acetylglucosamine transferase (SPINDLY family)